MQNSQEQTKNPDNITAPKGEKLDLDTVFKAMKSRQGQNLPPVKVDFREFMN